MRTRIRAALRPVVPGEILGDLPGDLLADLPDGEKPALPASVRAALDAAPVVDLPPSTPIMIEEYDVYTEQRHGLKLARPRGVRHRDAGDRPPPTAARSTTI